MRRLKRLCQRVLLSVVKIGTTRSLPEAFERLGLRFSANWPEAWGGVQAKVMEVLGVLRSMVEAKRARA